MNPNLFIESPKDTNLYLKTLKDNWTISFAPDMIARKNEITEFNKEVRLLIEKRL